MSLNSDFQKLYVDGLIHLYELDASSLGAGILRFHGHIAFQDWEKIYSSIGSDGLIGADTGSIGKIFDTGDQKYGTEILSGRVKFLSQWLWRFRGLKCDQMVKPQHQL